MQPHIHPANTFTRELPPVENGLRQETPTVYAATPEALDAACTYYLQVTRPGMSITERLNRVLALHTHFGAQTTHSFN